MKQRLNPRGWHLGLWAACACSGTAQAQLVIEDTLTGAASSYNWRAIDGACLTAGNGTGSIPACAGLPYYKNKGSVLVGGTTGRLPDQPGQGALRLTNGDFEKSNDDGTRGTNGNNQAGAVVSNFTFPSRKGLEVTFTTVTYGGNARGAAQTGADGMSFFLIDGQYPPDIGALGGSLGYSCSNKNRPFDGLRGAYLGVGIDEYGNFANPVDNTDTGLGYLPGRISLRAGGDTAWASLTAQYPAFYPPRLDPEVRMQAVRRTCATGYLHDYAPGDKDGDDGVKTSQRVGLNYALLASSDLPDGVSISNQQGVPHPLRSLATPITYSLRLTQNGRLSFAYSVNGGAPRQVLDDHPITRDNAPLPASFRFGFAGSTGGGNNVHEITCFKAGPADESRSSSGTNVPQSARVEAGTQIFLASYHPVGWWGELRAHSLLVDPRNDTVSIGPANWNAHCVLTGGACEDTGRHQVAQGPEQRTILTWNGRSGARFRWDALTPAQQTALGGTGGRRGQRVLDYLRGDRSREIANEGTLRTRKGVLGDIVNSGAAWVGPPSSPYAGRWRDALHPAARAPEMEATPGQPLSSYAAFRSALATRPNVVYIGANDGLLHGFRAGAYDAQGGFVGNGTHPNDGRELLAYMPASVVQVIRSTRPGLDYSAAQYAHNFFVDAAPGTGDLFYGGAWHTWLVGGLGMGGNPAGPVAGRTAETPGAIFALDITDPAALRDEASAARQVVGDWSSATITCWRNDSCGQALGAITGTPVIRRMHSGQWAVLFGNGLNSRLGTAGLFILLVDPASGATSFRFIDTGHGPARDPQGAGGKNGIAYVTAADLDGDHITDYVYGGDVFGNVWRFDLTSDNPSAWAASAAPVFSTGGHPITTRVVVASVPGTGNGQPRVVLGFGTGQRTVQTQARRSEYAEGRHALFGVWDWDLQAWNVRAEPGARYAALAPPQRVATPADLLEQSVLNTVAGDGAVSGYRTVSRRKVCWKGSSTCATGNQQLGWILPLPVEGEQVVYNPVIAYGMLIVNTSIPEESRPLTCETAPAWGYTMAVTLTDGGAAGASFFADADNNFVSYDGEFVSGIAMGAVGTPQIVTTETRPHLVSDNTQGSGATAPINPAAGGTGSRLTWLEVR